jgi:hypothetical protein
MGNVLDDLYEVGLSETFVEISLRGLQEKGGIQTGFGVRHFGKPLFCLSQKCLCPIASLWHNYEIAGLTFKIIALPRSICLVHCSNWY